MAFFGLFGKKKDEAQVATEKQDLDQGLERSRSGLFGKLARVVAGRSTVDDAVLDDLEEVLVTSDVGVETTLRIIERIQERVKRDKYVGTGELNRLLREEIAGLMKDPAPMDPAVKPYVIMVVGVNGVGKTTTIGKLAKRFSMQGREVMLAAGSLVTPGKVLTGGYLWGGRPARQMRALKPQEIAFLRHSAAHYAELKDQYLAQRKANP